MLSLGGVALQRKDNRVAFRQRVHCSVQPPPPAWPGRAVLESGRTSWDGQKPISVLGSTGSIGTQVIREEKELKKKIFFLKITLVMRLNVTF